MTDTAGLDLISTAVLLLKRDHRIVYANPAAENLFAQSRRQLVGARIGDVLRDADRLAPALELALTHRASYTEQELELHLAGKAAGSNGASRLLVNCTATGMIGKPPLEIDLGPLKRAAVVYDIVYVPLETALLANARARGHRTVDGLGMLLQQAGFGFHKWFGAHPAVTAELRASIEADIRAKTPGA